MLSWLYRDNGGFFQITNPTNAQFTWGVEEKLVRSFVVNVKDRPATNSDIDTVEKRVCTAYYECHLALPDI